MKDEDNRDDWDGRDYAEELFDPDLSVPYREGQGSSRDLQSQFPEGPPWMAVNGNPLDRQGYVGERPGIHAGIRSRAKNRCEGCGIDLSERRNLLHVHHFDRNKLNNEDYNLIALCALCHSDRDGHRHIKNTLTPEETQYLETLRKSKGIS
jgi:hypothetical protein